jgi:hypothetical protein
METGFLVKEIINTWKILKCDAGQGWRRAVGNFE